jgi:hypothetical protein
VGKKRKSLDEPQGPNIFFSPWPGLLIQLMRNMQAEKQAPIGLCWPTTLAQPPFDRREDPCSGSPERRWSNRRCSEDFNLGRLEVYGRCEL